MRSSVMLTGLLVITAISGCGGGTGSAGPGDAADNPGDEPIDTSPPTSSADVPGGTYYQSDSVHVSLTCTDGDGGGCEKIYYTLDGTEPGLASPTFPDGASLEIATSTTLKFFAVDLAGNREAVRTELYTVVDDIAPTVSVSPSDGAVDIPRTAEVVMTFSENMLASTITADSCELSHENGRVSASIVFNGNLGKLIPNEPLDRFTTYTASLNEKVTDLSGNALVPTTISFTTKDGTWTDRSLLAYQYSAIPDRHDLAVNGSYAAAVWVGREGLDSPLYVARYIEGSGWSGPELVNGYAYYPDVAVDSSGNVIVVWVEDDGASVTAYANTYNVGAGWSGAVPLETGTDQAMTPKVAMDDAGNAVAVWGEYNGVITSIYANRYEAGSGWSGAELLEKSDTNYTLSSLAMSGDGNAIAVWTEDTGTSIYTNRYVPSSGWIGVETHGLGPNPIAGDVRVAAGASGAVLVWAQYDELLGSVYVNPSIYVNRFTENVGWSGVEAIETDTLPASQPDVAINDSGDVFAIWLQQISADNTDNNDITVNRYKAGTGWLGAEPISLTYRASNLTIAMDNAGKAMAAWDTKAGPRTVHARSFGVGPGWGETVAIGSDPQYNSDEPRIGMSSSGKVFAIWAYDFMNTNYAVNLYYSIFE